jgi:hypothetical protein
MAMTESLKRPEPLVSRRNVLGVAVVTSAAMFAGVPVLAREARGRVPASVDLQDPAFNMMTLARLQGDISGRISYIYRKGEVVGIAAGRGLPIEDYGKRMYTFEGGGLRRSRVREDGSIETRSRNWLFYTDPETGEFLDEFENPYTGEFVAVPAFRAGISGSVLTVNGPEVRAAFNMQSTVFGRPTLLQYSFLGDTAWVSRYAFTRWTPPGEDQARTEFTLDVWTCRAEDLFDEALTYVPNTYSWTSQTEFQTWLAMPDDFEGNQVWSTHGASSYQLNELPEHFVARSRERMEDLLTDPLAWD